MESRRRSAEAGDGGGQFRGLGNAGVQQHARILESHDALEEDGGAEDACSGEWTREKRMTRRPAVDATLLPKQLVSVAGRTRAAEWVSSSRLIAAMAATEIEFHFASCSDLRSLELRALPRLKQIVVDDGKDKPYPSGSLRRVKSLELQSGSE